MVYYPPYPIIQQEGSGIQRRRSRARKSVSFTTKSGHRVSFNRSGISKTKRRKARRGRQGKKIRGRGFLDHQLKSLAGEVGRSAIKEAASLGFKGIKALKNKFFK